MANDLIRLNRPVSDHLHPYVYKALIGLALWFVLAVWVLFGSGSRDYMALLLGVVGVFVLIAVAIPTVIWLSWRKFEGARARETGESFREWMSGDVETWPGRVSGRDAAIEVLLPIAAVSLGMTAFGLVLFFTATLGGHPL